MTRLKLKNIHSTQREMQSSKIVFFSSFYFLWETYEGYHLTQLKYRDVCQLYCFASGQNTSGGDTETGLK